MKKYIILMILFASFASVSAKAQFVNNSPEHLFYKSGKIFDDEGQKLSKEDLSRILNPNLYTDYTDSRRKRKSGVLLTSIGGGMLLYGGTAFGVGLSKLHEQEDGYYSGDDWDENALAAGFMMGGALFIAPGVILSAIGIPKLIKGSNGLKRVAENYNAQTDKPTASLSFAPSKNGYGLVLEF